MGQGGPTAAAGKNQMEAWEEFLADDDRRMQFNDRFRGLAYSRPSGAPICTAVEDFMHGFGHGGVTAARVAEAIKANLQWTRRSLDEMVEYGEARVELECTRGPRASHRKVYFALRGARVEVGDMPEYGPVNDWACGGGIKVPVLPGLE